MLLSGKQGTTSSSPPTRSRSALVSGQARSKTGVSLSQLCFYNFIDIAAALGVALVINVALLVVAAATFHPAGTPCQRLARARSAPKPDCLLQHCRSAGARVPSTATQWRGYAAALAAQRQLPQHSILLFPSKSQWLCRSS